MIKKEWLLYAGDMVAIAVLTLIGFATHGETNISFIPRMAALFVPLIFSWFLLAPWLGLFQPEIVSDPKLLWRPVLAMLFVASFAAVLRGFILHAPILPIFVAILTFVFAFGMVGWRALYFLLVRRV